MIAPWLLWLLALAVLIVQAVYSSFAFAAGRRCKVRGDFLRPAMLLYVVISGGVWVWIIFLLLSLTFESA